jgi:hypothetical protein
MRREAALTDKQRSYRQQYLSEHGTRRLSQLILSP